MVLIRRLLADAVILWFYKIGTKIQNLYNLIRDESKISINKRRCSCEKPKVAIHLNRWTAATRCLIHILPIGMTAGILQLSFRTVYWQDLGGPSQNVNLSVLQFVAKFHEICIVSSLSEIVLHRIRFELNNGEGVPFGLLSSGFHVSSLTYLWSWEFWSGIVNEDLRQSYSRRFSLLFLIIFTSILAAMSSPSSAVAILPRLDWWEASYPPLDSINTFIANSTHNLWPADVTADFLPQDCFLRNASQTTYCPSSGFLTMTEWDSSTWWLKPNMSMPIPGSSKIRYLAASSDMSTDTSLRPYPGAGHGAIYDRAGYALASSTSQSIAKAISCAHEEEIYSNSPSGIGRPIISMAQSDRSSLLKPFVAVECTSYPICSRNMTFPHRYLLTPPMDAYLGEIWAVPETTWIDFVGPTKASKASWVDMSSFEKGPSGGIVIVDNNWFGPPKIVACTIDARWIPVKVWIDPSNDNAIHEDRDDLLDQPPYRRPPPRSKGQQIFLHQGWLDVLSVPVGESNFSAFEMLLADQLGKLRRLIYLDVVSLLLALYLADGLARLNSDLTIYNVRNLDTAHVWFTTVCSRGRCRVAPKPSFFASGLTRLNYSALRYGYGWGFIGIPIKLATTVLCLIILLSLVHIASILGGRGWTSRMLNTINETIGVAMNSTPTEKLTNTCAGIDRLSTWKKIVRVRETNGTHLELVFEDGSDEEEVGKRPVPGKEYGSLVNRRRSNQSSHLDWEMPNSPRQHWFYP